VDAGNKFLSAIRQPFAPNLEAASKARTEDVMADTSVFNPAPSSAKSAGDAFTSAVSWRGFDLPALAVSPRFDWALATLVGLALFALLLPTAGGLLSDPDALWHLRTGREILLTGHFPRVDSYSWTKTGESWIAKEWLSQVLYALSFMIAGWTGMAVLALAAASAAYALVFAALERRAGPLFALAAVLFIALAGNFHLLARPHVLAWLVAAGFVIVLLDAAEEARAPRWPFALLMTLWANLHGSFLLGFIVLPFFAWESLARARENRLGLSLRWAGFGLACLLAVLVHPYGWRVLAAARDVLELGPAMSLIAEWRPQNFTSFGHFEFILLLGLGAALLTGLRLPAPRVALLLALLHSALAHVRQETLGVIIVALLLGAPVAALQGEIIRLPRQKLRLAAFAVVGLLALVAGISAQNGPLGLPPEIAPQAALDAARAAGVKGQALNEDQFGGFLISQHVPTYVDGRAELFGQMHYDLSMALAGRKPEALEALMADPKIGWAILPNIFPANRDFGASPVWRRVFRDEVASVYARR